MIDEIKINRRNFLKAGVAVVAYLSLPDKVSASGDFAGNPNRFGILTDLTKCIGCRRCEAACNKANNLPTAKVSFEDKSVFKEKRRPYVADIQSYTAVNRYDIDGKTVFRKIQCMHCDEPSCASACPVAALKKSPEGPVTWNDKVCIGCRYCIVACPFYVPAFEYTSAFDPRIQKCFMCYHRISKGLIPACVEACPVGAIIFGKREDLIKFAKLRIWSEPHKYIDHIYGENEAGGTDWLYISGVPFERLDFIDVKLSPYPAFTKDFLSLVNLTLVSWPALFGGIYLMTGNKNHDKLESKSGSNKESNKED